MNIFVPIKQTDKFLEIIKEISIIDDYILDRERFGKQKIIIRSSATSFDTIIGLISHLPLHSMIVDKIDYPDKNYLLCVGEVNLSDLQILNTPGINVSILTIREDRIRFNAWIHLSLLEEIYRSKKVHHFSSMDGKIENETFFIFYALEEREEELFDFISNYSSEFIIKEKKIYVKLMLKKFSECYLNTKDMIERIEVIDEETFE